MGHDHDPWPWWVELALFGLPTRGSALAFFWLSILIVVGCVAGAFYWPILALGGLMVFAAAWYHFAIRWVDRHGRWGR